MARPFLFIGMTLIVVLVLLAPSRGLRLGVVGGESLPPGDPAAEATRLAVDQLGFPTYSPVLVVASGVATVDQAAAVEARLRTAAQGRPVRGPGPP